MATAAAVRVLVARTVAMSLCAAAFGCTVRVPAAFFTPFIFHQVVVLLVQLIWNGPRLLFDAAQVFLHVPLPPQHLALSALVVIEWMVTLLLFAAASSSTAVVVFLERDIRACEWVRPGACSHWRRASAVLTIGAWCFSAVVAILMFWIRVSVARQD